LRQLQVEREQARADGLLRNILPDKIADLLLSKPGTIAKRHDEVTVLFADIVGFTPMSARLEAEALVQCLDDIFTEFDRICDHHGVEKIKTIGDAYMAAGGVPEERDDHVDAVVAMAMDMIDAVAALAERMEADLQVRVGIHTGPVVAGVIGKRKFIYDLWGDTVNTASRMESHGVAGRVQITEETAAKLGGAFVAEPRGAIQVKGKGSLEVYLVARKG
jgi:class 3 adenylate cyclase